MNCNMISAGEDLWQCTACDWQVRYAGPVERIHRECDSDRKPGLVLQAWNLTAAIAAFILRPGFVALAEYRRRLQVCESCPRRSGTRCSVCTCVLHLKARAKAWHCPLKKW